MSDDNRQRKAVRPLEGIEADYYDACGWLYGQLEFYTHNDRDKKRFKAIALQMNDKVMEYVAPHEQQYFKQAEVGQLEGFGHVRCLGENHKAVDTRICRRLLQPLQYA